MHIIFTIIFLTHLGAFFLLGGLIGVALLSQLRRAKGRLPLLLFVALGLVWFTGIGLTIIRWGDFTLNDNVLGLKCAVFALSTLGLIAAHIDNKSLLSKIYLPSSLVGMLAGFVLAIT